MNVKSPWLPWLVLIVTPMLNFHALSAAAEPLETTKLNILGITDSNLERAHLEKRATALMQQLNALSVQPSPVSTPAATESRESVKDILFGASDTIESLASAGAFVQANELAELKLKVAEQVLGNESGAVLDALQDRIFLASQQHKSDLMRARLDDYTSVATLMRQHHETEEVEVAANKRQERLRAKLDQAMATILKPL